jgi:hypothetical protein
MLGDGMRLGGGKPMETKKAELVMIRRGFLKLGFAGVLGSVLLFLSGCLGEEDEEEDDEDDDGSRRRRRRRG